LIVTANINQTKPNEPANQATMSPANIFLPLRILLVCMLLTFRLSFGLVLLSDLPTPSLVVDVDRLLLPAGGGGGGRRSQQQQQQNDNQQEGSESFPPRIVITLPQSRTKLHPALATDLTAEGDDTSGSKSIEGRFTRDAQEGAVVCLDLNPCAGNIFWHTSVVQSRGDQVVVNNKNGKTNNENEKLAKLDMPCCGSLEMWGKAQLVLGWNNHHVISYYWARSAGAGAAMEAPGVIYDTENGILKWESAKGPTDCNTNDGKRSEWVNFLRKGDQVQLLPDDPEQAILQWCDSNDQRQQSPASSSKEEECNDSSRSKIIYGISSYQRPMGSDPAVVCQWNVWKE